MTVQLEQREEVKRESIWILKKKAERRRKEKKHIDPNNKESCDDVCSEKLDLRSFLGFQGWSNPI